MPTKVVGYFTQHNATLLIIRIQEHSSRGISNSSRSTFTQPRERSSGYWTGLATGCDSQVSFACLYCNRESPTVHITSMIRCSWMCIITHRGHADHLHKQQFNVKKKKRTSVALGGIRGISYTVLSPCISTQNRVSLETSQSWISITKQSVVYRRALPWKRIRGADLNGYDWCQPLSHLIIV